MQPLKWVCKHNNGQWNPLTKAGIERRCGKKYLGKAVFAEAFFLFVMHDRMQRVLQKFPVTVLSATCKSGMESCAAKWVNRQCGLPFAVLT